MNGRKPRRQNDCEPLSERDIRMTASLYHTLD